MISILLAEDDEALRIYLARALENADYEVVAVDHGTEVMPY
jgi:two-component system cell cycle response regulator CpdR